MALDRHVAIARRRRASFYALWLLVMTIVTRAFSAAIGAEFSPDASHLSKGRAFEEQGGAALFAGVCAGCHQADASGATGAADYPALKEDKALASADYVERLLLGGQKGMPPVGRMMSDQQVADVINYVRTHFGNAYDDAVSAADVEAARRRTGAAP